MQKKTERDICCLNNNSYEMLLKEGLKGGVRFCGRRI